MAAVCSCLVRLRASRCRHPLQIDASSCSQQLDLPTGCGGARTAACTVETIRVTRKLHIPWYEVSLVRGITAVPRQSVSQSVSQLPVSCPLAAAAPSPPSSPRRSSHGHSETARSDRSAAQPTPCAHRWIGWRSSASGASGSWRVPPRRNRSRHPARCTRTHAERHHSGRDSRVTHPCKVQCPRWSDIQSYHATQRSVISHVRW